MRCHRFGRVVAVVATVGLMITATGPAALASAPAEPGQIVGWGLDQGNNLLGAPTSTVSTPVTVPGGALTGKTVTQVSIGLSHACALDREGLAYCWGSDNGDALGDGVPGQQDSSVPEPVDTSGELAGKSLTLIEAGRYFTCALDTTGKAYCWGSGPTGTLGAGTVYESATPVAVDMTDVAGSDPSFTTISVNEIGACGISAGLAYCWGDGYGWEIGNGQDVSVNPRPTPVSTMGALAGKTLVKISAGAGYNCALDSAGKAYCWGARMYGAALGAGPSFLDGSPVPVPLDDSAALAGKTLKAISVNTGGCVLDTEGKAYCWGPIGAGLGDNSGPPGLGAAPTPVAVNTSGVLAGKTLASIDENNIVCAVDTDGAGYCWGNGVLGNGTTLLESWVPVAVDTTDVLADRPLAQIVTNGTDMLAVTAAPAVAGAPDPPTSVSGQSGDGEVTVSWTPPNNQGTSALTGYTVTAFPGSNTCVPVTVQSPTCTVSGLINGTGYEFSVVATNAAGDSLPSVKSSLVVPLGPPGRPSGTTVGMFVGQEPVAHWTAPATNGGSPITGYTVTALPGGATCAPISLSNLQCVLTGLASGTDYAISVTATNAVGTGAASTPAFAFTPIRIPGAPQHVVLTPGNQRVNITWQASASTGGSPITSYTVHRYGIGIPECTVAITEVFSCTVTGLTNGTSYRFAVQADNAIGGAASPWTTVTPVSTPGPPVLTAVFPHAASVGAQWLAPNANGSPIVGYVVTAYPGGHTCASTSPATRSCTVTGLANGTAYSFRVRAINAVGTGTASNALTATPKAVPNAPVITSVTPGNGFVNVAYTAPFANGSPITGYIVRSSPIVSGHPQCGGVGHLALTCRFTGLADGTRYAFTVIAVNSIGNSRPSAAVSATPAPTAAPARPGILEVLNPGRQKAFVDWAPVLGAASYRIRITRSGAAVGAWITLTAPTHTFTGLTYGAHYTLDVQALNRFGASPSRSLTFRQGDFLVS